MNISHLLVTILLNKLQPEKILLDYLPTRCPVSMFLTPVTDAEIISIVSKLPNKKSCDMANKKVDSKHSEAIVFYSQ
jgi:hypothetical protein